MKKIQFSLLLSLIVTSLGGMGLPYWYQKYLSEPSESKDCPLLNTKTKYVESKEIKIFFIENKLFIFDKNFKKLNEYNIAESCWAAILDAEVEITEDSVKATASEQTFIWQIDKKIQSKFCTIT